MREAWRWFGPSDPIPLAHVRQAGATDVVTALHRRPSGSVWPIDEIEERKAIVDAAGLRWSVVESLPVSENIKARSGAWREDVDAYRMSLANLASCGIRTVCYNFMPLLDWTRTDLSFAMPNGSRALRFDADAFAAFDLFILRRANAEQDWHQDQVRRAAELHRVLSDSAKAELTRSIIAGLPGAAEHYSIEMLRDALLCYGDVGVEGLRTNLVEFIRAVAPTAMEHRVNLCIHPDDPPFSLLGLPRIVSVAADVDALFAGCELQANGLTFCTGSFGVRAENHLAAMIERFAQRIHFVHLRNTRREPVVGAGQPSFHEADHLAGDVDMVEVIRALLSEERRRVATGRVDAVIPMRPDHGHQMLDDLNKQTNPGYSAIGRLRGLAELRGIAAAIHWLDEPH